MGLRGSGTVEKIEPVDLVEKIANTFDPNMRQMSITRKGQIVNGIEDLYMAASVGLEVFGEILLRDIAPVLGGGKSGVVAPAFKVAPLKQRDRAGEKARDDYSQRKDKPGESWLYDIVRGMLECDTQDQICDVAMALRAHPRVQVVRLKNRFLNVYQL